MERYRVSPDGAVDFVTSPIVGWSSVFLADSPNHCHRHNGFRINAYVIMPSHFHGIVFFKDFSRGSLKSILVDFRKLTGRRLSDYCSNHMPSCFGDAFRQRAGADREKRLWHPSLDPVQIESERFWKRKLDDLHENPCRNGLVHRAEAWRFSSASYRRADRPVANDVFLSPVDW